MRASFSISRAGLLALGAAVAGALACGGESPAPDPTELPIRVRTQARRDAKELVDERGKSSTLFEPLEIGPQPLSKAEVAAVGLAAGYLEQGPRAWSGAFAAGSGWESLAAADLIAELLARLGPNAKVRWTLQKASEFAGESAAVFQIEHASGFDEAVLLELVEVDGVWRIQRLATNVDPAKRIRGIAVGAVAASRSTVALPPIPEGPTSVSPVALASIALLVALFAWPRPRHAGRVLAMAFPPLAGLGAFALLAGLACADREPLPPQTASVEAVTPEIERLGTLARLKSAIAQSGPGTGAPPFEDFGAGDEGVAEVARLWQAQWRLQQFDLDGAEDLLGALAGRRRPLRHLLRARLNYFRGDFEALEAAYRDAQAQGIDHAGLRLEAVLAYSALGRDSYAEAMLDSVGEMGARQSFPYFALSRVHARNGRIEDAIEMFLSAWQLAPLPRRQIFQDGALAWLATRPRVLERLEVSSPTDPLVAPGRTASSLQLLPEGFESTVSGEMLEVRIGDNDLLIPGGGPLAPAAARVATASEIAERAQRAALNNLERFDQDPESLTLALTNPQAADAMTLLAHSSRWDRILELTEGLEALVERVSPEVVKMRAFALEHRGRGDEARRLLLAQARNDRVHKRFDPEMFFQLGELLVRSGEYDLAVRLIERGNATTLFGRPYRPDQIRLEKQLVADDRTYSGSGFEVRYPRASGRDYPVKVTKVLTAERRRLSKWVPIDADVPIKVDLYPFLDFMQAYGGPLSVVGLFDGRVRVPFADLHGLQPEIVSILSHELAHAMIAARTNDNAPKWFHEGLAQHVEMSQPVNPIPELRAKNRVLSLPVIEAILGGMAESQYVELAYAQSVWAIHYIEAAFGVGGIHRLLGEFSNGATTAEAIERALGLDLAEFDRRAWDWCANDAPEAWKVEVRRYDRELNGLLVNQNSTPRSDRPKLTRGVEPVQPQRKLSHAALALWHRRYKEAVQGVHAKLLPVLRMGTGEVAWDHGSSCALLMRELESFRSKRTVLNSPDPELSKALVVLHASQEALARSCVGGESPNTTALAKKTMTQFQDAARKLESRGLKP